MSSRRSGVWLGAVGVAVMIHVDWHLGRPGHESMSMGLSYHWLIAVPTVIVLTWQAHRRRPKAPSRWVALVAALGLVLGQGLEPLAEMVLFPSVGTEPFTNPVRWRILGEFVAAGAATYLGVILVGWRRASGRRSVRNRDRCFVCLQRADGTTPLIQGPGIHLCAPCAHLAAAALASAPAGAVVTSAGSPRPRSHCSFCGRAREEALPAYLATDGMICRRCVDLSLQVLVAQPVGERRPTLDPLTGHSHPTRPEFP